MAHEAIGIGMAERQCAAVGLWHSAEASESARRESASNLVSK